MKIRVDVTIKNSIPEYIASLRPGARQVVQETGDGVVSIEQSLSRVDTGEMKAGWTFEMTGDVEGVNYNPVPYTVENEYGTTTMPAQPMLHPAVDQQTPVFLRDLVEVVRG